MNESGQSLVQVMIAVAIMGIVTLTFATMMANQQRQMSQVSQKMAILDLERTLTATFADSSNVCSYMVTNPGLPPFDPTTVGSQNSPTFTFQQIPSRGLAGSSSAVSSSATAPASPLSTTVYVNNIQLSDLTCVPTPCTPTTNQFNAKITVSFDPSKLVMPLAPLQFPVMLSTTGTANSQVFSACGSSSGSTGSGPLFKVSCSWVTANSLGSCTPHACPNNYTQVGPDSNEVKTTGGSNPAWNGGDSYHYCTGSYSSVLEIKCPWSAIDSADGVCTPAACPSGYTDTGWVSSEYTAFLPANYVGYNMGNHIRTCVK